MSVVLDASLIVAVVVADERQDAARAHVRGWLDAGEELHAPTVLPYEVADVLARPTFDGALDLVEVDQIWADVAALGLVVHPFELIRDGREVAAITARLRRRHATDSTCVCSHNGLGRRCGPWTGHWPVTRPLSDCRSDSCPDEQGLTVQRNALGTNRRSTRREPRA